MRVVSLVPSVTETLLAWGLAPIACTRFCEQPGLRTVGGTKNPDVAAIVDLHPDLVVMDEEENRREDHQALVLAGVPVHALAVRDVAHVGRQLPVLAERLGLDPAVAAPAVPLPDRRPVRAKVFVPIWRRPWMALGAPTYGSSLLGLLGFDNVMAGQGPYPAVTLSEARASNPDVVVAPSEPYPFGPRHAEELGSVGPTIYVDGKDLFWWGARTAAALQRLRLGLAGAT